MDVEGCFSRNEWLALRTKYYKSIDRIDHMCHEKARKDWQLPTLPSCKIDEAYDTTKHKFPPSWFKETDDAPMSGIPSSWLKEPSDEMPDVSDMSNGWLKEAAKIRKWVNRKNMYNRYRGMRNRVCEVPMRSTTPDELDMTQFEL